MYNGSYVSSDSVNPPYGYWLKFDSSETILLRGIQRLSDTIDVKAGWNMIGSLALPLDVKSISTEPDSIIISPFYRYDGSYSIADTLLPMEGYWLKSRQEGRVFLGR